MTVFVAKKPPLHETLSLTELQTTFKSKSNELLSKYSTADMANRTDELQRKVAKFYYNFQPLITTQRSNAFTYNILLGKCGKPPIDLPPVQASREATRLVAGLDASQIRGMLSASQNPVAAAPVVTATVAAPPSATLNESSLAPTQTLWEWAVEKVVEAGTVVRDSAVAGGTVVYNGAATGASAVYNGAADSAAWMQSFVTWTPAQQQDVRAALQERLSELEEQKKS